MRLPPFSPALARSPPLLPPSMRSRVLAALAAGPKLFGTTLRRRKPVDNREHSPSCREDPLGSFRRVCARHKRGTTRRPDVAASPGGCGGERAVAGKRPASHRSQRSSGPVGPGDPRWQTNRCRERPPAAQSRRGPSHRLAPGKDILSLLKSGDGLTALAIVIWSGLRHMADLLDSPCCHGPDAARLSWGSRTWPAIAFRGS